jgi:hypothetical protein
MNLNRMLESLAGWAMPVALRVDYATLATRLGHTDARHDCLPRRQGRCPGIEYCHDCEWTEGISRQDPR